MSRTYRVPASPKSSVMLLSIYQCSVWCIVVRISYPATAAMPRFVLSIIEMQYASPDIKINLRSMRWIILRCSGGEYSSSQSTLLLAGWLISSTFSMLEGFSFFDLNIFNMKAVVLTQSRIEKSWVNSPAIVMLYLYLKDYLGSISAVKRGSSSTFCLNVLCRFYWLILIVSTQSIEFKYPSGNRYH